MDPEHLGTIAAIVLVLGALAMNLIVWTGLGGRVTRLEKEVVTREECHTRHEGLEKAVTLSREVLTKQIEKLERKIDALLVKNGLRKET